MRAADLPLYVTCAVHKFNFRMLPDIIRYFGDELKLPHFSFSGVSACEAAQFAMDEAEFHEAMHLIRLNEHPGMTLTRQMSVLADGTFVPCPALCGEVLGRSGEASLADAWKKQCGDPGILDRRMPDAECASCRYSKVCRGLCPGVMCSELRGSWRNFCLRRHVDIYGSDL